MRAVFGIILVAALLAGLAPRKGSVHATSGSTTFKRDFSGSVSNLVVAPATQTVKVLHHPHYVNQDTFEVDGGDVMNWKGLDIYGFTIIRDGGATAVDVYWY